MIFGIIYSIGLILSAFLLYRISRNYEAKHPDNPVDEREYGFFVIGTLLSWITVFGLLFGALAGSNKLDLEEVIQEEFGDDVADAIDEKCSFNPEEIRRRNIEKMREQELKAAQEDAIKYKNNF